MRPRTMLFRLMNSGGGVKAGALQIDLIKSRTRVRWVKVDPEEITWTTPKANGGDGITTSIRLDVTKEIADCPSIQVRVDYVGGAPVIGPIRGIDGSRSEAVAKSDDQDPLTRLTRREKAAKIF